MPFALAQADMTPYYEAAVRIEMSILRLSSANANASGSANGSANGKNKKSSKTDKDKTSAAAAAISLARVAVSRAIARCSTSTSGGIFYDMSAEIERSVGNHKEANHVLWRKKQIH
jgi:hypothetical protein